MAGLDRQLDPNTGDYIRDDDRNTVLKSRDATTPIYHQVKTEIGQWLGDPDAGSRFTELDRAKSVERTQVVIRDIMTEALAPLVDDGRITPLEFRSERDIDRVDSETTVTDLQTGETLVLTDLLSFEP